MWELKSKIAQRHIHILSELFVYKKDKTIKELSDEMRCDVKTVKETINDINNLYDVPRLYLHAKKQVLTSENTSSFYMLDIFKGFYQSTTEFVILEHLFIEGTTTINELSDKLYISTSTMNRFVSHLRINLEKYGIKISTNPLTLVGEERIIRAFFVQYYKEKNSCTIFPRFNEYQETIFSIFERLTENKQFSIYKPFFNDFRWLMFVPLVRNSQGNFITTSTDLPPNFFTLADELAKINDVIVLRNIFLLNQDINEVTLLYDLLFFFYPEQYTIIEDIELLKDIMSNTYYEIIQELNLKLNSKILSDCINTLVNIIMSSSGKSYFLFNTSKFNYNNLVKHFPKSVELISNKVNEFLSLIPIDDSDKVFELTLIIINITPNIYDSMRDYEDKLLINLFLVTEESKAVFIQKLLTNRFGNLAQFILCDSGTLLTKNDISKGIWVSDIFTLNGENMLIIEPNIIYSELPRIKYFLYKMRNPVQKLNRDTSTTSPLEILRIKKDL